MTELEAALAEFLPTQRWFAGKGRAVAEVRVERSVPLRTALPKVKAVVYFDRLATPVPGDACAWLADSSPEARAGFAAGVSDSYLNQPRSQRGLRITVMSGLIAIRILWSL